MHIFPVNDDNVIKHYQNYTGGRNMQELKGSKTYDNLLIAYAGESQAKQIYFFCRKSKGRRVYADSGDL